MNQPISNRNDCDPRPLLTCPQLGQSAGQGIAAKFVEAIYPSPVSERASLLIQTLSAIGCLMGRGAFLLTGLERHYPNVNSIIVGERNNAIPESHSLVARELLRSIDPEWSISNAGNGLLERQQYIDLVRDPIYELVGPAENSRRKLIASGSKYKSVLVLEPIGSLLGFNGLKGDILLNNIRNSWMGLPIWKSTASRRQLCATDATITFCSVASKQDLTILMVSKNRIAEVGLYFLWGYEPQLTQTSFAIANIIPIVKWFAPLFRQAINFAKHRGQIAMSPDAESLWANIRSTLLHARKGLHGQVTDHAESHFLKLALTFALLDQSTTIAIDHIRAGLAVWDFSNQSSQILFGNSSGCPFADKIELVIRNSRGSGISRSQLSNKLGRNLKQDKLDYAISLLESLDLIVSQRIPGNGRTEVRYFHNKGS